MPYVNICVKCHEAFETPNKRMPACDVCRFGLEGKRLAAQLKERDAILDEAMRRAEHEGYCAVHEPIAGVEEDCNCGLAALRARIEAARK